MATENEKALQQTTSDYPVIDHQKSNLALDKPVTVCIVVQTLDDEVNDEEETEYFTETSDEDERDIDVVGNDIDTAFPQPCKEELQNIEVINIQLPWTGKRRGRRHNYADIIKCEKFKVGPEDRPYQCGKCEKFFANIQAFILHNHTREYLGKVIHRCEVCDKTFPFPNALRAHLRVHTGERPFVCEICNCGFTAVSSLNKHKQLHAASKPVNQCEYCSKTFKSANSLKIHRRFHTGEKPYQCRDCEAAFESGMHLKLHTLREHVKEKQFICKICNKGFYLVSGLRQHLHMHTGYKPFLCHLCFARFRSNSHLQRHIRGKHGGG